MDNVQSVKCLGSDVTGLKVAGEMSAGIYNERQNIYMGKCRRENVHRVCDGEKNVQGGKSRS